MHSTLVASTNAFQTRMEAFSFTMVAAGRCQAPVAPLVNLD